MKYLITMFACFLIGLLFLETCSFENVSKETIIQKIEEGYDQVVVSRFTKQSVIREPNYGFVKFGNKFFTFFANILLILQY